jgi:hypothetical protein
MSLTSRVVPSLLLVAALLPEAAPAEPLRVQVPHQAGSAVQRALLSARRRLGGESCRRVLSDFDSVVERRPLGAVLESRGATAQDHLDSLVFKDGSGRKHCARPEILAFTSVGSDTVFVCSRSFVRVAQRDPALAEMVLIHEALHTLGLGENPPTSVEITARIEERCGDRQVAEAGTRRSGDERAREKVKNLQSGAASSLYPHERGKGRLR